MRGRLINPFLAELAQLDTEATAADPDGSGDLTSGYDDDFRETVAVPDGSAAGTDARQEKAHILVPCQVEVDAFDMLRQMSSGDSPDSSVRLVFHFADLERMGLVDATTGTALIRKNDRLHAIRQCSGYLVQLVPNPPGLYATEPRVRSFGLSGGARNLLVVQFQDRERSTMRGAS